MPLKKLEIDGDVNMKYRKIFYFLFALSIFTSCKYGIFNQYYPNKSELEVYIDNEYDKQLSKTCSLTLNLDDEKYKNKYLKIKAQHLKNDKIIDSDFKFSSKKLKLNIDEEGSVLINLSLINELGVHTVKATSLIDKDFDISFSLIIISSLKSIDVKYSIDKVVEGLDYDGSDRGEINSANMIYSPVYLISASSYTFIVNAVENLKIPKLEFSVISKNKNAYFEKINDNCSKLIISKNANDDELNIHISILNSDIKIIIPAIVIDIAMLNIGESDARDPKEQVLLLKNNGERKLFNLELSASSDENRKLCAFFIIQNDESDKNLSIAKNSKKEIIDERCEYMSLYFDQSKRMLSIIPHKESVFNGKNVYQYLYIWDERNNYLGRWRIIIGGFIESVKITNDKIDVKTQQSGVVSASVYPQDSECDIIWYLSKGGANYPESFEPLRKTEAREYVSFINNEKNFEIEIDGSSYSSSDYTMIMTSGNTHNLYYTTGTNSGTCYLVALERKTKIFDYIPVLISSDGSITIRCEREVVETVVPSIAFRDTASFINSFEIKNFPDGQYYPLSAENDKYGSNTRSFYLPHNETSKIEITTSLISQLMIEETDESKKIYTFELLKSEEEQKYILYINPIWLSAKKDIEKNNNGYKVAQCQSDGRDSYGKIFFEYLGVGSLIIIIGNNKMKIRISIFDNNSENFY